MNLFMEFRYLIGMLVFFLSSSVFSQLTIDVVERGKTEYLLLLPRLNQRAGEHRRVKL